MLPPTRPHVPDPSCLPRRLPAGGPHRLLDEAGELLGSSKGLLLAGPEPLQGASQLARFGLLHANNEGHDAQSSPGPCELGVKGAKACVFRGFPRRSRAARGGRCSTPWPGRLARPQRRPRSQPGGGLRAAGRATVHATLRPAMGRLRLELLGGVLCPSGRGRPPASCRPRRPRRCSPIWRCPPGGITPRDKLTALLWGDTPETQARHSFRQALSMLRRALRGRPWCCVRRATRSRWTPRRSRWTSAEFELARGRGDARRAGGAATLYRGDLLAG